MVETKKIVPLSGQKREGYFYIEAGVSLPGEISSLSGSILAKKGAILSTEDVERLKRKLEYNADLIITVDVDYELSGGVIVDKDVSKSNPYRDNKVLCSAVTSDTFLSREGYKQTAKVIKEQNETTKVLLHSISTGGIIQVDELLNTTHAVLGVSDKKQLLTCLTFLNGIDDVTYAHSLNVSLLCGLFGKWLGYSTNDIHTLELAGTLHDVGKLKISPDIINKPGKLTDEEYAIIKTHSLLGYRILQEHSMNTDLAKAVLMHHERIDGSGYPTGAKGNQIPEMAAIVTICDIYDAMTSFRPYREPICPFEIIYTFENKLYGNLDPRLLMIFLRNIVHIYLDFGVELSDGRKGKIVFINERCFSKPLVQLSDGTFVDLAQQSDLTIKSLL